MDLDFHKMFQNKDKSCDVNIEGQIDSINILDEIFEVNLKINKRLYKGIAIKKGEIFPNPEKGDILIIDKIYFEFDDDFISRIYIHAKKKEIHNYVSFDINNPNESFDFSKDNIIKTLKDIFQIKEQLLTNLFIVDSIDKNDYSIKCLNNLQKYTLDKNNIPSLNAKDFILINDYYFKDNKIILSQMTIVYKLNDEKLFFLLENGPFIDKTILWGKIIEINESDNDGIIILMDKLKNILKFKNINKDGIQLGQFFLFINYDINKETSLVTLNKESFYYFSSVDVYFSNRIKLNEYSLIQLNFLDYKKDNNIYNTIRININNYNIISEQMDIIVQHKKIKNNEICTQTIILLENEENFFSIKYFKATITQGFLTKISALINHKSDNSYYYEYLYYSFNSIDFLKTKKIKVDNLDIDIKIYDDFGSKNRRKFNILNIPFQDETDQKELKKKNSLLVCEIFFQEPNMSEIYGIFDIEEIEKNIPVLKYTNNIYDIYYNIFGNVYDYFKNGNNNKEMINFIDNCQKKYKKYSDEFKKLDILSVRCYDDKISLSQLKTRIGIIISHYINNLIDSTLSDKDKINNIKDIEQIVEIIADNEHILSKDQILRLFMILTRRKIDHGANSKLYFFSKSNEHTSPYRLAIKNNIDEINNINEFSKLFSGYLQMDSQILLNYNRNIINYSYSFSLEPLFILKHHLISNYEDFCIVEKHDNNIIASTEVDLRITIINERKFLSRAKIEKINNIEDNKLLKDIAFGLSMVFRHEKNSHQKKNMKNQHLISPYYYCNNGSIRLIIYEEENNTPTGEDGILIETLITEDRNIIMSLVKDFIYGELLDYRLFIQNDFKELLSKAEIIIEKNKKYFEIYPINKSELERNLINKMQSSEQNNIINSNELALQAIKQKELRMGDQIYSLDLIKEMISIEKKKGQYDLLPDIIKKIDIELEKMEKNN